MEPVPPAPPPLVHWLKKVVPLLTILVFVIGLGGIALTFLLPSQMLKPDALAAQALVEKEYLPMLDAALRNFPKERTAYIAKEECWGKGKDRCIYGWYAEWKGSVYLMSFTHATEEEDRGGLLRGWWWEVDVARKGVRPVWRDPGLQQQYGLQPTDDLQRAIIAGNPPERPTAAPLLKKP